LTNYGLAIQLYGRHNTSKIMNRLNENFNFTRYLFKTLIALKESQEYKDNFLIWGDSQAAGFLRMKILRFKKLKRRGWIRNEAFITMQNVYRPQTLIDGLLKKIEL
jgi:GTP-sensing pleiotropic transcriptional regulator CodY